MNVPLSDHLLKMGSDAVMFWVIQAALFVGFLVAFVANSLASWRARRGGITLSVERGNESMGVFYGSYLAMNGLLVATCLTVEPVREYRIFWVLIDTIIPAYLCVFNPWSRNKLLHSANRVRTLETE